MLRKLLAPFSTPRRRKLTASSLISHGAEQLENLSLLSATASGIVYTVPQASTLSGKVTTAAKPPADFSGPNPLNGSLGPGNADITQNGSDVTVVLSFTQHPEYNGLTLIGTVKGRKLVANFEGNHNGIGRALFKAKMAKDGNSFKWKLFDSPA
ncbi:MAG: hypothetical protein KDA36_02095 [Planctomycetaceae bacterium]|nr:hypothetical protein [Planctomycetaceae bacterium]